MNLQKEVTSVKK